MVDVGQISSVYNALIQTMTAKYELMWQNNEIDAETYAQLVGQASSQLISLSAELVQKQEQLEDTLLTASKERDRLTAEIANVTKQGLLLDSQKAKVDADKLLTDQQKTNLTAEALNIPKQGLLLDQDLGIKERSMADQEATSFIQRSLLMEQIESENKQQLIADQDLVLKQEQEKTIYTERLLVDKQVALLGLDEVMKSANTAPQAVYTPKYKEV
jgi:hypothetical protein